MIYHKVVHLNGIEISVDDYRVDCEPDFYGTQNEFLQWNKHDSEITHDIKKNGRFDHMLLTNPNKKLMDYFRNEVIFSYLCDDFTDYSGAKILHAKEVTNGADAKRLIEHVLNRYSNMSEQPFFRYTPFSGIKFKSFESRKPRRTMNLQTGAIHPEIPWREMWNIYVSEHRESS